MKRVILLLFVLTFVGLPSGLGQVSYIAQTHTISIPDGLLSPAISVIYEDSRGIIWIGTNYGLNSYDGINLVAYTKKEHGLFDDYIQNIQEDIHGKIWIQSAPQFSPESKISVLDPSTQTVQALKDYTSVPEGFGVSERLYNLIQNEKDGSIWLLFEGLKIYEYNGVKLKKVAMIPSGAGYLQKLNEEVTSYFKGNGDPLYSLIFYNHEINEAIDSVSNTLVQRITHVVADTIFWLSLNNRSSTLLFYSKSKNNPIRLLKKVHWTGPPISFIKRNDQHYYIGNKKTVAIFNKQGALLETIYSKDKLNFDLAYLIDKRGGIWFKDSEKEALRYIRYQTSSFKTYDLSNGNPVKQFRGGRGFCKLNDSTLLMSSVIRYQSRKLSPKLTIQPGGANIQYNDQKGRIYNLSEVLDLRDDQLNLIKTYRYPKDSKIYFNWSILEDLDGKIWIGNNKGLAYLDREKDSLIQYNNYNGFDLLKKSIPYHIHNYKKQLYLCTSSGFYLWDKEQGAEARYLNDQIIHHLHEDKDGLFWLATKGGGLIQFNPKTGKHQIFTTANGLANNVIYAVYEDAYNKLWMSSDWGIMSFDKNTHEVTNYTKESGLLDNEFNTFSHYKDEEGNLHFGSQKGLVIFHPKDFQGDEEIFPLRITKADKIVAGSDIHESTLHTIKTNNRIDLYPTNKGFELNVSLLDYRNPKLHQYAYKIEGLNNNWQYQLSPNIIEKNLPYGHYKINVKVKGLSGKWQFLNNSIRLIIHRPFYAQWWFILFLVALLGLSIFAVIKWRTKKLLFRQKELEDTVEKRTEELKKDKEVIEKQAKELQALDKVKSRFFANISHELRTPLTLILGPLSYILDSPTEWDNQDVRKQLTIMQRNGKSLMQLIEEILDLSKLEANKLELEEEPTSIRDFFEYIFYVFEPQFENQGLNYQLIFDLEGEDLNVLMDRKKMEKVLNNFLSNAIKFTPQSGKITLVIKEGKELLNIKVTDTGKGVHPNDLPYIFERFYQSKQADQKLYGGTGIGLALVKEFAVLMNGNAYASSILGSGSTFVFESPKKVVEKTALVFQPLIEELNQEVIENIGTDFTILVVEDNHDMRGFVCQLLEKKYNVLSAQNGVEGLAKLKEYQTKINLILSDVMMPEMDGLTMLKQIKSNTSWNGIPVIMLTALAAERDKLKALSIGVDDYLTKPFSVTELMIRVQNLLYNYHQRLEWKKQEKLELTTSNVSPLQITEEVTVSVIDTEWVNELKKAVTESLTTEVLTIDRLANLSHTGERQLRRRLKKATGLAPLKFIKEVQLYHARETLENGTFLTVSEVAYHSGFENLSTFSKVFKKRFGKSPIEYLK